MKTISSAKNFQFHKVQLGDSAPQGYEQVQLLKTGSFLHPLAPGGQFDITSDTLRSMVHNFSENVRRLAGGHLAVDYSHESGGKASGWIQRIELREDDTQLWIYVEWTPNARQKIEEKEFRFISADVDFNYVDNESGTAFGPTLLGAGLTNRPHIKDMEIILNEQGVTVMNYEQLEEGVKKLNEDDKKKMLKALSGVSKSESDAAASTHKSELDDVNSKLTEVTVERDTLKTENVKLAETEATSKKEVQFGEFLRAGKIKPAQKEAFMKLELSSAVELFGDADADLNLDESGTGTPAKTKVKEGDKPVVEASKEVETKALELIEKNEGMSFSDAASKVLDDNDALRVKYEKEVESA